VFCGHQACNVLLCSCLQTPLIRHNVAKGLPLLKPLCHHHVMSSPPCHVTIRPRTFLVNFCAHTVQYEPDAAKWEAANTTEGLAAASSTLLDMTRYWDQYYPPADVAKQLALPYR
jgi:hypothetical protein